MVCPVLLNYSRYSNNLGKPLKLDWFKSKFEMKIILIILLSFLLASCAALRPEDALLYAPFSTQKANRLLQPGTNAIKGSAAIRQRGGGVVHCGANQVSLIPATDYAAERLSYLYGSDTGGFRPESGFTKSYSFYPDPLEYTYLRKIVTCDASGNFEFVDLADGSFFVITSVTWVVGNSTQGGALMLPVTVGHGEVKRIVLSP